MKTIVTILIFIISLYGASRTHQADKYMSWNQGNDYCFILGGRMISVYQIEQMYKTNPGSLDKDVYWTRDRLDMEGADSFDFKTGVIIPEHESKLLKVLCVN